MKTRVEYSEKVTKVYDSYTYTDKEIADAVSEIMKTRKEMGLPVTRNATSYISEWKSHNRLYRIGYQRSRTKDVDLEEEIDKTRDFLYSLFGFLKKIINLVLFSTSTAYIILGSETKPMVGVNHYKYSGKPRRGNTKIHVRTA